MKRLSQYLVNKLREEQHIRNYNKANRIQSIDLNNYFKETDKIEIKGRFVSACKYALPIPEKVIIKNDMSKYKLIKRYETNKTNTCVLHR